MELSVQDLSDRLERMVETVESYGVRIAALERDLRAHTMSKAHRTIPPAAQKVLDGYPD